MRPKRVPRSQPTLTESELKSLDLILNTGKTGIPIRIATHGRTVQQISNVWGARCRKRGHRFHIRHEGRSAIVWIDRTL